MQRTCKVSRSESEMSHERIMSLDDKRLDVYRNLKTQNKIRDQRLFIAEGPTVVERVLKSSYDVHSIVISDRKYDAFHSLLPGTIPVFRLASQLADQLVGFNFHCGVMACVVRKPTPPAETWLPTEGPALIIAGDRITDPENVGALIRIASAFGANAVILGGGSADPFSRRVLRVSMGNVLFQPVIEVERLHDFTGQLITRHQCHACAAVLSQDATALPQFRFPARTVLLLGNEYDGLSSECLSVPSAHVTIPMLNRTDSLNVATSSAVFLYQYRCQYPAQ